MGKMIKKGWLVITVLALIIGILTPVGVAAQADGKVVVDGKQLETDIPPSIIDGRMMVPMRAIFEALGADVTWDGKLQAVHASKGQREIYLEIGNEAAFIGFQPVRLDVAPIVQHGRTLVPLRFVSESLGADVKWQSATKTAFIYSTDHGAVIEPDLDSPKQESETSVHFNRTKQEIRNKWNVYKPVYSGTPYEIEPQTTAPYKTGKLKHQFIQDGVNMANFVRYLAGLPDDLVQDDQLNERAQYGAVLLQAFGSLTHYPGQPADMDDSFYEQGALSARSSNISQYRFSTTGEVMEVLSGLSADSSMSLATSVIHYMRDEDDSNVRMAGHRRWILNPQLKSIGFGYSHRYYEADNWKHYERYSTMEIMDQTSREEKVDYDYVAWPSAGYFPTEFFGTSETYGSDPWSISLNPNKYEAPDLDNVKVTLTEKTSGKSWTIDKRNAQLRAKQSFFNVNLDGYGIPYAIIFRPDDSAQYVKGSHYEVKVTGLRDINGQPVELQYETAFFDL